MMYRRLGRGPSHSASLPRSWTLQPPKLFPHPPPALLERGVPGSSFYEDLASLSPAHTTPVLGHWGIHLGSGVETEGTRTTGGPH